MSTIHLISHTHWDREWYLTFQQFRLKLVHLIDRVLEILQDDQDFKYFLLDGQTILLDDYLQIRPEKETELRKLISEGRILIGPWYVSPDEFLVAPESHIRNLLEGKRHCIKFGGIMLVGYLPDSFGHIGQMPQILQGFGISTACLWRGLDDHSNDLIWKSPDGSSVLLAYLRNSYSNAAGLTTSNPDKFANDIQELSRSLLPNSISDNILIMHGTDHMEPSADLPRALHTYQQISSPDQLIHSNLPKYFDAIQIHQEVNPQKLDEVSGELRSSKHSALLQNVLSTRIWLKQRNHSCENDILKWVEPISAWVNLLNQSQNTLDSNKKNIFPDYLTYSKSIIQYSWQLLMQCHPHDSICGTSIDQVAKEMGTRFDHVDQVNTEMIKESLERLGKYISTRLNFNSAIPKESQDILSAIVVFNCNDAANTGIVTLKYKIDKGYSTVQVIDDLGMPIPLIQTGMGSQELISMVLDKKSLKQALGMIHEGVVAGMVIRDFELLQEESNVQIHVTLSDHGVVDLEKWRNGLLQVETVLADPKITKFIIRASSDPEISLSMIAQDVPSHGYRCYWIRGISQQNTTLPHPFKLNRVTQTILPVVNKLTHIFPISNLIQREKPKPSSTPYRIENEYFVVEANLSDNGLTIIDKQKQQVYNGLNRFIDSGDCGDLYNFCPPAHDLQVTSTIKHVDKVTNEIVQRLIVSNEMVVPRNISEDRKSRSHQMLKMCINSEIILVPGVPRVDIHSEVDNQVMDHRLRVHFPAPFYTSTAWHDGHYEIVKREIEIHGFDETWVEPPRPEVPQREFTSITDGHLSLTIANCGLPEVEVFINDVGNAEIALTLLRCVGWLSRDDIITRKGHAGPMGIETPGAQLLGKCTFDYSIIPGDNEWARSIHQGQSFNSPMRVMNTSIHSGILPHESVMIENNNKDFLITAIKLSEDDTNLIVRGFNLLSTPIDISLKPWMPFKHTHLTRLDEKNIQEIIASPDGTLNIHVDRKKIITLRFSNRNS